CLDVRSQYITFSVVANLLMCCYGGTRYRSWHACSICMVICFRVAKQGENDLGVLLCVHTISNLSG
ncbi:hypothetical protein MKW98_029264, partial [Papaver atlanticum]